MAMLDPAQLDPEQRRPITRAEYQAMGDSGLFQDERVELIDGVIVRMAPRGEPHDTTIERLNELLLPRLVGRARVRIHLAFAASEYSELEPDVAVIPRDEPPWVEHPTRAALLIEVAASSLRFDRGTKAAVYARAGVPEYWVVDVSERTIEVFGAPDGERYTTSLHRGSDMLSVPGFPDVCFTVDAVFSLAP